MKKIIRSSQKFWRSNRATILAVISATGVIATAVLVAKETPKALEMLKQAEAEKGDLLNGYEKTVITAKAYAPAIASGGLTIVCIAGSSLLNKRQQASLASAYALIDQSYKDYRRKLKELYGEDAHNKIMESLEVEQAEKTQLYAQGIFDACTLTPGDEEHPQKLFYEPISKRFFKSTLVDVMNAEYHLNRNYVLRNYVELNEFYAFLGLTPIHSGYELGWTITDDEIFWLDFNHREVKRDDGLEYYVIESATDPFPIGEFWGPY